MIKLSVSRLSSPSVVGVGTSSSTQERKAALSPGWQIGILFCALLAVGIGYKTTSLIWIAAAGAAVLWIATRLAIDEYLSLLAYVALVLVIILQPPRTTPSLIDFATGIGMVGLGTWWAFRSRLLAWESFSVSWEHLLIVLFFLWTLLIGVGGMLFYANTPNDWIREALMELPIVLIPYLCVRAMRPNSQRVHAFLLFLVAIWILVGIANIIAFRNNVLKAVYFYQTGRAMLDPSSAILLFFATMAFASIETKRSRLKWYVLPASLATIGILLTAFRTIWLSCMAVMVVMVFLSRADERKQLWAFLRRFMVTSLSLILIAFFKFKLVHMMVLAFIGRFASSAYVATDPSLVNRYIEWRTILGYIKASPFVGYGYGGLYWDFDWLKGISYFNGYTHSTILYILFKSGLIGLTLVVLAYGGFMHRGWKVVRSNDADKFTRAIMRVAFCFLLFIIPSGMTLNAFGNREGMMWIALCMSFILIYDTKSRTFTPQGLEPQSINSEVQNIPSIS